METKLLQDYQILQRNESGYACARFAGKLPDGFLEQSEIFARVVLEEDQSIVMGWEKCMVQEDEWWISLELPEGGLYRIEACHRSDKVTTLEWCARIRNLCHIGVGDLYLLAGQSNMAGYGKEPAYDPPCMDVHLYGNNGRWSIATHPLNDSIDTIYPENAEYATGTSPALSFGRTLMKKLHVPIGLVQASLGGSALSVWNPAEDGTLYRAMLRRLDMVGKVKGILWYQGCTDAIQGWAETYLERFETMVQLWRKDMGSLPIITVQLNGRTHAEESREADDRQWGILREAQRQAAKTIPDILIVPTIDLTISDGIHNTSASNVVIGERMANAALCGIYHQKGKTAASVSSVERLDDTHILVRFPEGHQVYSQEPEGKGLEVEDAKGLILCKQVENVLEGLKLTLKRPFALPAEFHAFWRCEFSGYAPRDSYGIPMLACYGVKIEESK